MDKHLMSGNEAIAQGAWEAGVAVGVGYPGTPSTETLEALVRKDNVYCEWSPNEKVAFEVALGAAIAGVRALVTMKHVGVNVAADPFMAAASTGVNAGLVLLAADDPSCYSSQNEQDSRFYAAFGRIPCLDAADSQECYEMTRAAFELSERFDTPVMLHETMRIAHTRTLVAPAGTREAVAPRDYADDIPKYVMMPANARQAARRGGRAPGRARGVRGDLPVQRGGDAGREDRRHLRRRRLPARPRGAARGLHVQARPCLAAAGTGPRRLRVLRGRLLCGGGGERLLLLARPRPRHPARRAARRRPPRGRRAQARAHPRRLWRGTARASRARHGPPAAPAGVLPRLPAPPGLYRAAPPQGHRHRRHRLLHARRRRALRRVPHGHRHGRIALHGARHGARPRAGAHGSSRRGRHRRLHVRALRHHEHARHHLQRRHRHPLHPGQPHHGHDRHAGQTP